MNFGPLCILSTALAITMAFTFNSPFAWAEGEAVGDTQSCIQLSRIDESPAVDSRTILIKMRGRHGGYKRIDLAGPCPGITFSGYMHSTYIDRLCKFDTLRVLQPIGAVCLIDRIVTIDEAEAKALAARK